MNKYDDTYWVVMFSRSGKEIADICKRTERVPNLIITTKQFSKWDESLRVICNENDVEIFMVDKLEAKDAEYLEEMILYEDATVDSVMITTHGWLYIIPEDICGRYKIFNGHPGDIVKHPELKGINPQEKAVELGLSSTGSVVHRTIAEVDEGQVLVRVPCKIKGLDLHHVYNRLRETSLEAWVEFFDKLEEFV